METKKRLVMSFMTVIGRAISISVDDPRENITEAEIKACMDLIVSKDIFSPYGSKVEKAIDAKIVVTDTTEFDLVV